MRDDVWRITRHAMKIFSAFLVLTFIAASRFASPAMAQSGSSSDNILQHGGIVDPIDPNDPMWRGIPPDVLKNLQQLRALQLQRQEASALQSLRVVEPSDPLFLQKVDKIFTQFPSAINSPEVQRLLELKKSLISQAATAPPASPSRQQDRMPERTPDSSQSTHATKPSKNESPSLAGETESKGEAVWFRKMRSIIFPTVQLTGASVEETFEFLSIRSRDLDTHETSPQLRGVNFIMALGTKPSSTQITVDLINIPLLEAVRYVTRMANLTFDLTQDGVLIRPKDSLSTKEEIASLQTRAAIGDSEGQSILGFLYFQGEGVAKDKARALELWREAADQGDVYSQFTLGKCLMTGDGTAQDKEGGIQLVRMAAAQGSKKAQDLLQKLAESPARPEQPKAVLPSPPITTKAHITGNMQNWTKIDGRSMKAALLRVEGANAVLMREDGQTFFVPISTLSAESQIQANRLIRK